jgi:hypothetical protein
MTVAKLKGARDRVRRRAGKCEGRKSYAERAPELVELAKAIKSRGGRVSLREVSAELAARGARPRQASPVRQALFRKRRAVYAVLTAAAGRLAGYG